MRALDRKGTASFPYLATAEFSRRDIPARLFRVSFSGELTYELAIPTRYGDAVLRAIVDAGDAWEIVGMVRRHWRDAD